LQLNMMYQKYFDLLREFTARFPDVRILGDADIYVTCENTVNFRQTLREAEIFLHLTRGKVYLVNAARTHVLFGKLLKRNISRRLPGRLARRVKVRMMENPLLRRRLLKNKKAIILSSATPLEWRSTEIFAGIRVHETTPMAKTALMAGLLRILQPADLEALFRDQRRALDRRYQELNDQSQRLERELVVEDQALEERAIRISDPNRTVNRSLWGALKIFRQEIALHIKSLPTARKHRLEKQLAVQRIEIRHQARELIRLERELSDVPHFLRSIGIQAAIGPSVAELRSLTGDRLAAHPPVTVGTNPLNGKYRLDVPFILFPMFLPAASPARRSA